jgi:hypothetical protein
MPGDGQPETGLCFFPDSDDLNPEPRKGADRCTLCLSV